MLRLMTSERQPEPAHRSCGDVSHARRARCFPVSIWHQQQSFPCGCRCACVCTGRTCSPSCPGERRRWSGWSVVVGVVVGRMEERSVAGVSVLRSSRHASPIPVVRRCARRPSARPSLTPPTQLLLPAVSTAHRRPPRPAVSPCGRQAGSLPSWQKSNTKKPEPHFTLHAPMRFEYTARPGPTEGEPGAAAATQHSAAQQKVTWSALAGTVAFQRTIPIPT